MDRRAHRHPPALHRGGGREDLRPGAAARRARRSPMPASTPASSTDHAAPPPRPTKAFPPPPPSCRPGWGSYHGAAFDVQAVCSGFIYALSIADSLIRAGRGRTRPGDRRGDHDPADGLDRPRHLRPVRRRGRRGGAARPHEPARGHARDRGVLNLALRSDGRQDELYVDGGPSTRHGRQAAHAGQAKSSATRSSTSPRP